MKFPGLACICSANTIDKVVELTKVPLKLLVLREKNCSLGKLVSISIK